MAINWSSDLYKYILDAFAVPCTIHPVISDPDGPSVDGRCYYDTRQLDVIAEDGSIFSDQQTYVDLRTVEWPILPAQKDRLTIPFSSNGDPLGDFEIVDTSTNAGGLMTLIIRKFEMPGWRNRS